MVMSGGSVALSPRPLLRIRRGNRDVVAPGLHEAGRIARFPGADWTARRLHARQRSRELIEKELSAVRRAAAAHAARLSFERSTDARALRGRVRRRVAVGLLAADIHLEKKRERLRQLLRREQAELAAEAVARAQCLADERRQRAIMEAQQLRAQLEKERQEQADKLRQLQIRLQNPEIRMQDYKEKVRKTKETQKYQIHEKIWKRAMDKEEEKFWGEITKKNYEAMKLRQEEEARAARSRELEDARTRLEQMEAQRRGQEEERTRAVQEERMLNERVQAYAATDKSEYERRRRQQREQREALNKQRAELHATNKAMEEAERRYGAAVIAHEAAELKRADEEQAQKMMQHKRAALRYMEHVEEMRERQLEEEKKTEEVVQMMAKAKEQESDRRRCQIKNIKLQMLKDALEGRAQQLEELRAQARAEALQGEEERRAVEEAGEASRRLAEEVAWRKCDQERRYAHDLEEQMRHQDALKSREKALERERLEKEKARVDELEAMGKKLLEEPSPFLLHHPMLPAIERDPPPHVLEAYAPQAQISRVYDGLEEEQRKLCADAKKYSSSAVPANRAASCMALEGVPRAMTAGGAVRQRSPPRGPRPGPCGCRAPCRCPRQPPQPPCHVHGSTRAATQFNGVGAGAPPPACFYPPVLNAHDPGSAQGDPPPPVLGRKTTGRLPDIRPAPPCYACR